MSDRWLTFNPVLSPVLLLSIMAVLTVIFLWMEWKRKLSFPSIRIGILLLMIVALCGILLRPSYRTQKNYSVALLTTGYSTKQADSLRAVDPNMTFIRLTGAAVYENSTPIRSYHKLSSLADEVSYVLGEGLPSYTLDLLPAEKFVFLPAGLQQGIVKLEISEPVFVNRKNRIEGVFYNPSAKTKLSLSGPGALEDSAILSQQAYSPFQLSFVPRQAGIFLYTLTTKENGHESKEILPITVQKPRESKILFLQHYPTFETQYIKNFLGKHHQVLLRYQLSKNTYRYEYINHRTERVDRVTEASLSPFDLLIIDSDAFQSLSSAESRELKKAIKAGLGMTVLFNTPPQKISNLKLFLPQQLNTITVDTAHFRLSNAQKIILPSWPVEPITDASTFIIAKNKNRTLAGYQYNGAGKVGFQLLQETYRLALEGDSIAYSTFWSELIEQVSRIEEKRFSIKITTPFPVFEDEPINISIISSGEPPTLLKDNIEIPLLEDVHIDDVWYGKVWADKPGWHSLMIKEDSTTLNYYVSEKSAWPSLVVANAQTQTSLKSGSALPGKKVKEILAPVPAWIFYLTFLLCSGFLWLAPKL
jgi:hypothetical protein